MNSQMSEITFTGRDGRVTQLETVYIRGSKIRFFVLPDMLRHAPVFKKYSQKGLSGGGGKASLIRAASECPRAIPAVHHHACPPASTALHPDCAAGPPGAISRPVVLRPLALRRQGSWKGPRRPAVSRRVGMSKPRGRPEPATGDGSISWCFTSAINIVTAQQS